MSNMRGNSPRSLKKSRKHLNFIWVLGLLALIGVGVGVYMELVPGVWGGVANALFGPPKVEMKEAYANGEGGAQFDHSAFDALLRDYVDKAGWVDYKGLLEKEDALDSYLAALKDAPFDALRRDEKLALLINAYNAFTLKLILDYYPVDSIKDIPEDERWDAVRWELAGQTYSLDQLEHEQIRPKFREPRIHFALVCAAVGCPPLLAEAYTGAKLDEQLEMQTEYVHNHSTWLRFDPNGGVLQLTPLYKWYEGDFTQSTDSVLSYVARYSAKLREALDAGNPPAIEWLHYDWSLNSQENAVPR